ncbi:MAG: Uma2 family endonuclease [Verrucomicrobia bacterium]|nr:Uma2 family endonuclease [Leptolyngbya sp. ES-bin-22]
MVADSTFYISPEDYLEAERVSPIKHEYRQGRVYAMVGAKKPHVIIAANLTTLLNVHLRDQPCVVMASDIKVRLEAADCYYYPDVVVTCDPGDLAGTEDFIHYPKLVIEVLSKSTAKFDSSEKFTDYQTCSTLEEYVLVSQTERSIEVRSLINGTWNVATYQGDASVTFHSLHWSGTLAAIYQKVTLAEGAIASPPTNALMEKSAHP